MLLLYSCRHVEQVLRRILNKYLGLIVRLVAALRRRLPAIRKEPLDESDPTKPAVARRRFGRKQQPVNAIRVWSCKMLRVYGVPHDRATIQRLPGWSPEMDSHQITLTPVKQDRMRHRWRGGANWTGIFLDSSGVCSQEKDIPPVPSRCRGYARS